MKKKLLLKNVNKVTIPFRWSLFLFAITMLSAGQIVFANDDIITIDGGTITGGPFAFCVGDGEVDNVYGIELECESDANRQWVVTDESGNILGLPPSPEAVDFDGAGAGTCLIWHLSYADGLQGLEGGNNVADLEGTYDFSNSISVYRNQPEGGEISGGPFEFIVGDGVADNVWVDISGNSGGNSGWVITDEDGNILGLPSNPEVVNFDGAGVGTCLIWHISYADGLEGLVEGGNAATGLVGCYDLSNSVAVVRTAASIEGGELSGGPFTFCVGDGEVDNVSGVEVSGNEGSNSQWVVTDESGNILGLPPSPEVVDFDGAGAGVCLIWHLSYADGLQGLEDGNNVADLEGTYDFSNSISVYRNQPNAGEISGGPFNFTVDGTPDMVSGITLDGTGTGSNSSWVITDDQGNILGLPPTLEAVEGVDFDGAGAGTCLIWYLRFEDGLEGAEMGKNANDLKGCFSLSNSLSVVRTAASIEGGELSGGPFTFCVGDGEVDNVSGVEVSGNEGSNSQWVVTDESGNILGLPPSPEVVDFDGAGAGVCLIWHLSYADGLQGLEDGNNVADLEGTYDFSNSVSVYRNQPNAGEISGGPFNFTVDGTPDMVSGITLDGTGTGSNSSWVITDDQGNILGLPPTLEAVEGVDFDGAGAGTCLIWYLRFEDGLEGAEMGKNANDLKGCFSLSNSLSVVRTDVLVDGGTITGGPFEFCVGDGEVDNVYGVELECESDANRQWVITDESGNILGLPPSPEVVDFDGAGAGVCLIWHLSYADGLQGLEDGNNVADLEGTYDFSNSISVYRNQPNAGEISGGPFNFTVDGTPDMVSGITLDGTGTGSNSSWVITDDQGNILGLPPTLEAVEGVDFDGAGAGTCLIWYLRFEDGLEGAEMGKNANDLKGCFSLSNSLSVVRTDVLVDGGFISGGPFEFCVGDGEVDNVYGVELECESDANRQWVITDESGNILGLPPSPEVVDFDGAGAGVCLIWHLSYADGLQGLEDGNNVADLVGTYDFSNSISVYRNQPNAGEISGGPFNFTVDGTPDMVSGITLDGTGTGSNSSWVITDDQGNILGLPPTLEAVEGVDFDGAGAGTCLIWYLRFEDGLEGAEMGKNANDLKGCFSLSNSLSVVRTDVLVDGGTITGGPFEFCVGDGEVDNVYGIGLSGNTGTNSQWIITDDSGKILGLPPTLEGVEGVDFDGAGVGVCLIWHLSYEDGLEGLEPGGNAATGLTGTYNLSNEIPVYRSQPMGGEITGETFEFIVGDGKADHVNGVEVTGNSGANSQWVITDESGKILGLPASPDAVDFDGAGEGVCLIWHLSYEDGLEGLEDGGNAATGLTGCYSLSNSVRVERANATGDKVGVVLYPLPASNVLNVSLKAFGNSDVRATLFDFAGNVVKDHMNTVNNSALALDVQTIPAGVYLLRVTNNEGKSVSKKVLIE